MAIIDNALQQPSALHSVIVSGSTLKQISTDRRDTTEKFDQLYKTNTALALWIRQRLITTLPIEQRGAAADIALGVANALDTEQLKALLTAGFTPSRTDT